MSGYPGKLNQHANVTLIEPVDSGLPVAELAQQLNVSRQCAYYCIRRFESRL